jgi:hypothetical protein
VSGEKFSTTHLSQSLGAILLDPTTACFDHFQPCSWPNNIFFKMSLIKYIQLSQQPTFVALKTMLRSGFAAKPRIHRSLPLYSRTTLDCFRQDRASAFARMFSTNSKDFDNQQALKTPLPNPQQQQAEPTLLERSKKNILERFLDKYSVSRQTNRILIAESFLQAATTQASDP